MRWSTTSLSLALLAVAVPAFADPPAAGDASAASANDLASPLPVVGDETAPVTRLRYALDGEGVVAESHVALDGRAGATTAFPIDGAGTASASGAAISPRARLGLDVAGPKGSLRWLVEYEQDLPTGTLARTTPDGQGMPDTEAFAAPLRKASLRLAYRRLIVGGGVTTSNWGLGLVANGGAHGWEPGSARFADPRGGDRVVRGYVATGPYTPYGLVVAVAGDHVLDDDVLLTRAELGGTAAGDGADQALATVTVGRPDDRWAGAYVAYRKQTAADGRTLRATVADLSAIGHRRLGSQVVLMVGAEAAYIRGTADLAPTIAHPEETIGQLGVALRSSVDLGRWGAALDGLYASGDDNLDDGQEHGFHANHNFDLGFILFSQVQAAQSARGATTAGDPTLVGQPMTGVERIPTRGSATNTIAVFPRAYVRPARGVELYGGPLLAWAASPVADPFNTTISGGQPTNALGGHGGGRYLGTELDLGARSRLLLWGAELSLGVEGGVLLPGGALRDAMGARPAAVKSVRALVGVRI